MGRKSGLRCCPPSQCLIWAIALAGWRTHGAQCKSLEEALRRRRSTDWPTCGLRKWGRNWASTRCFSSTSARGASRPPAGISIRVGKAVAGLLVQHEARVLLLRGQALGRVSQHALPPGRPPAPRVRRARGDRRCRHALAGRRPRLHASSSNARLRARPRSGSGRGMASRQARSAPNIPKCAQRRRGHVPTVDCCGGRCRPRTPG